MSMFCFQCQEAAKGTGCTVKGVCGKTDEIAASQDTLIYVAKGVSFLADALNEAGQKSDAADKFVFEALFITITNANFDNVKIEDKIHEGMILKAELLNTVKSFFVPDFQYPDAVTWYAETEREFELKRFAVSILSEENEDIRSLKELLTYGLKGMAAYAEHAYNLGYTNNTVFNFMHKALAATLQKDISADELTDLVLECGKHGVDVMALLDQANTESYGHPELSTVNIGVRKNPGILISGHDLKDMEELLKQTEGTGIDVYTHSEMLPANYYPAFKKYKHLVGNYGNAWWKQKEEFESFNGPVLLTTNCLVPPKDSYKNRVYTTGAAGFDGCVHIPERKDGQPKDFSAIIEHARYSEAPLEIEQGSIVGGFAHNQVFALADKVVDAVKSGAVKQFVVMAGCDGKMKSRDYYTEFANELPKDNIILTAGCAKYRYNKLSLGDIGGIPRVLDAGQCNDSYSLAVIALKLKEVFELNDINELPITYNIAWYEQKAVIVLLALLYLGVKNIHLGPTLPAFVSPGVAKVLIDNFGLGTISDVESDLVSMSLTVEQD
ncbi:hydroxylamine reductase [Saccharicrinis sp. FJH62]|uniref:hydroxylamine reductase n=1 Tax=Saccharicrinis sp. FJH62 TaxID=3344657 RepID=UPI0035D48525